MGITGLLPIFKQIMKVKNIKEYKNKRIAIDAFGWIHSIATVVSFEIYNGIETTEHLKIFKNKVNELVKNKIIPIFVFDGDFLEAKKETCEYRKANKLKAKKELQIAIESGDEKRARDLMKRCVEITPSFIYDFMMCLNEMKIEFFIAPYEADAQMAYLSKIKYVDYVMTEDSDLILYGCKNILFKSGNGQVQEFDADDMEKVKNSFYIKNILKIAVLSGCDYLSSIKGVGLSTAAKYLEKADGCLRKCIQEIKSMKNKTVPPDYLESVYFAIDSFRHHIVYDPFLCKRVHFEALSEEKINFGSLENSKYLINLESGMQLHLSRHFKYGQEIKEGMFGIDYNEIESPEISKNSMDSIGLHKKINCVYKGRKNTNININSLEDCEKENKKYKKDFELETSDISVLLNFDTEKDISFIHKN